MAHLAEPLMPSGRIAFYDDLFTEASALIAKLQHHGEWRKRRWRARSATWRPN